MYNRFCIGNQKGPSEDTTLSLSLTHSPYSIIFYFHLTNLNFNLKCGMISLITSLSLGGHKI